MISLTEKQKLEMLLNADERVAVHANDILLLSDLIRDLQRQINNLEIRVNILENRDE